MYALFPAREFFLYFVRITERACFLLLLLAGTTTVFADSFSTAYMPEISPSFTGSKSTQSNLDGKLLQGPDDLLKDFRRDYATDSALEARIEKKITKLEKNYLFTDRKKFCISLTRLDKASALSDNFILFENKLGSAFINHLRGSCPRLALEDRFSYEIFGSTNLCQGMMISVLDPFGRIRAVCALGYFQVLDQNRPLSPKGS